MDDATWTHHLRRGDYSRWFREVIKDDGLVEAAESARQLPAGTPAPETRRVILAAINDRYTLPAESEGMPVPARS